MAKTLTVVSKWENAPGYRGDLEDGSMALSPMGYRGAATWDSRAPGIDFLPYNGEGVVVERASSSQYFDAYQKCAPLQAIINKLAQAHANSVIWVLNRSGKAKGKESESSVAKAIRNLLESPNPLQTQDEFEAQGKIFQKVFGYNVVFLLKPIGYKNHDADEMWNLPANMLDIKFKPGIFINREDREKRNAYIQSVTLSYGGYRVDLPLDCIYIQKDFTPSIDTVVLPESRIRAISQQVNNILSAYSSRGALIHDRGAQGIISSGFKDDIGTREIPEEDISSIQRQSRRYGIQAEQFRYIITRAPLQFTQVGFSTKDLMLFEEIEDDVSALCNAFDYPARLMGVGKSSALSQSDVEGFDKLLYQNNILPTSKRDAAFWNTLFETAANGLLIDFDYSHLPALQENLKERGEKRDAVVTAYNKEWEMGACSINEMRLEVGDDPITIDDYGVVYPENANPYNMRKPAYDKYLRDAGLTQTIASNESGQSTEAQSRQAEANGGETEEAESN